jgi:hypothetical protein
MACWFVVIETNGLGFGNVFIWLGVGSFEWKRDFCDGEGGFWRYGRVLPVLLPGACPSFF